MVITEIDDRLMASAASTGESSCPVKGYSTPAATGDLPAAFAFDRIGRPSAAQSIDLGGRTIVVEDETGYTHEN